MKSCLHILHLEDDPNDAELVQSMLEIGGINCEIQVADNEMDFLAAIENGGLDVVLADYSLPSFDGMTALSIARARCPEVPFLFISGNIGEELAIESLKKGATDYVIKHQMSRLVPSVERALRESEDQRKRREAEESLARRAEELRRSNIELKRSNEELEQFAYVASHDLQEPVRMVSNFTQLLARRYQGQLDDKADQYIHYIVDGAARMKTLIGALLSFSGVSKKEAPAAAVDCLEVLNQAQFNLKAVIEESQAVITHDMLPELYGNAPLLVQVFQNLIGNSIKFCTDKKPEIHIGAKEQEGDWLISVKDNGIGIDPQFAKKIFVIFQRLHTRSEYEGTGIGLSLCKRIIQCHNGNIWVDSIPGKGATFFFTLPKNGAENNDGGQRLEPSVANSTN